MFLGRSDLNLLEVAYDRYLCGSIWFRQFVWGFLPCGVGLPETIPCNWTDSTRPVHWTGMAPISLQRVMK